LTVRGRFTTLYGMTDEPAIVHRPAQPYVAVRVTVTMQTIGEIVPPLNREVFLWLAAGRGRPAGPPFWKFNVIDMERGLEVEAGVAVAEPVAGDGRVLAGVLPEGDYVTMRHTGHPDTLVDATGSLLDWAASKGLAWDMTPSPEGERWGARLEIYHSDPATEPDMTKWVTELAFRLADERRA
jgi:effector-binding domain-containing protein